MPRKAEREKRTRKDPGAPKRALTAYMIWLKENRSHFAKEGMKPTEVIKAASESWRNMTDKSKWEQMAANDKVRYEREMAVYKNQH